jgi:hypothetical protein
MSTNNAKWKEAFFAANTFCWLVTSRQVAILGGTVSMELMDPKNQPDF